MLWLQKGLGVGDAPSRMSPSGRPWLLSPQLGINVWSPFCCHFLPLSCLLSPPSGLCPPGTTLTPAALPRSLNHRRAFVTSGPVGLAPGASPGPALCQLLSPFQVGFHGHFLAPAPHYFLFPPCLFTHSCSLSATSAGDRILPREHTVPLAAGRWTQANSLSWWL